MRDFTSTAAAPSSSVAHVTHRAQLIDAVLAAQGLTGAEKVALIGLAAFSDVEGHSAPSNADLAAVSGLSPSTLFRTLRRLEALAVVKATRRRDGYGGDLPTEFFVNSAALRALGDL